ncbi:MAG: ABC transporter substrate-binding protein [Chitinophagaceae bacterium]|nr:ABC transporter substrate-binding protein [Chitinophagaceae bacterium]
MSEITDQISSIIPVPPQPQRIISLVPSITELLYDLGLEDRVAGITKFCVRPEHWFRTKTRVGGTKNIKIDTIQRIVPDLIIANKEENVKEQIEVLTREFPVWVTDISNYDDALEMIFQLGQITGKADAATQLNNKIQTAFDGLAAEIKKIRTAYLIWKEPWMTVGGDTFIHHMMEKAGLDNVFGAEHRYPIISLDSLQAVRPELVLLSSEPFPFKQKDIDQLQSLLPDTRILLADGEIFSWYGSRLLHAPLYFQELRKLY